MMVKVSWFGSLLSGHQWGGSVRIIIRVRIWILDPSKGKNYNLNFFPKIQYVIKYIDTYLY